MADYSIWVLEYSYVTKYHKSGVLYGAHNQGYVKLPYCYALIKSKNHVAMVDVGYNDKEYGKVLGDRFGVENWHNPKDVLAGVGLTPEDVDTVFISHAHFDHFGNVEDFPKATFYIQEREITKWVWAMSLPDRLRWMMVAIDPGDIIRGVDLARQKRLVCVDGTLENVLPNIDLHVAYDSHTYGSMWVHVRNDGKSQSSDAWALAVMLRTGKPGWPDAARKKCNPSSSSQMRASVCESLVTAYLKLSAASKAPFQVELSGPGSQTGSTPRVSLSRARL